MVTKSSCNVVMRSHQLFDSLMSKVPWSPFDRIVSGALVAVFLMFYGAALSDFPDLEDDGLFVLSSAFLGTAHSPGYPLFILLSQVVHLLPVDSTALRVHLFGALTASTALGLLYYIGRRYLCLERAACLFGVACVAFSTLFWEQALIAEAYQLNGVLFLLLFVLCSQLGDGSPAGSWLVLVTGFVFGLSLANHWPLTILMSPVFLSLAIPWVMTGMRMIPLALVGVLLGLFPYVWMFVTSTDTGFSHMGKFPGLREFLYFVFREVYSDVDQQQIASISDKVLFFRFYIREMADQFSLLAFPLVVAGIFVTARRVSIRFLAAIAYSILFPFVVILLLDFTYTPIEAESMSAYFLCAYMILGMMLMAGASLLMGLPSKLSMLTGPVMLLMIILGLHKNRDITVDNEPGLARSHGNFVLSRMPPGANLFVMDSWLMTTIAYLHYVDRVRPDVHLYSQYGTFLPNRLFNYFSLGTEQKWQHVERFIQGSKAPTFMLAPPDQMDIPYTDLGYAYRVGSAEVVQQSDLDFLVRLLRYPPRNMWERLSYEDNANRLSGFLVLDELDEELYSGNFLLNLIAAEQLVLSETGGIRVDRVQALLGRAETMAPEQSEFDWVRLQILKGHLMVRVGWYEIARNLYELALQKLPVEHNKAVPALANLHALTCDTRSMDDLHQSYPDADLDDFRSQMTGCDQD